MRLIVFLLFLSFSGIAQVELVKDTINIPARKVSIGVIPKVVLADSILEKKVNESLARACMYLGEDESFEEYIADIEADSLSPMFNQQFYGFEVTLNQDSILSLIEEVEGCGAYCETYQTYANIDVTSGKKIKFSELFRPLGISKIKTWVSVNKQKQILDLIEAYKKELVEIPLDSTSHLEDFLEHFSEVLQVYKDCNSDIQEWELEYFYMYPTHLYIRTGRCSNHALRALDDLGDFYFKIPYEKFAEDFTPFGKALIERIKVKGKSPLQKAIK